MVLIKISKQLLVVELFDALNFTKSNEEQKFEQLNEVIELIVNFYNDLYKFEIEEKEVIIPEIATKLNSYQLSWVPMIRENINQMIRELENIENRKKEDNSPIKINLILESPKNIDEFIEELTRLYKYI